MTQTAVKINTQPPTDALARYSIGLILDGKPPNGTIPSQLGPFAELYNEMLRAHKAGGTEAARRVYVKYAELDPAVVALRAADPEPPKLVWTVAELLTAQFADPQWAVPDLIPTGLVVLAGRPKLGKSWMALSLSIAVSTGGVFLGRKVAKGKVLYLALEDNPRRIQDRLRKQGAPANADIDFRFEWRPLESGGTADLIQAINENAYTLVVIDTASRALGKSDQLDQGDMNAVFGSIQRVALEREICILPVDHHRKSAGGVTDVIDDVMGATGKIGPADAVIGLYRGRGEKTATLKVSGREIDDQELALQWDMQLFCWQMVGTVAGVRAESVQGDIMTAIKELGGTATVQKVANWLERDKSHIYREMQELVTKCRLRRGTQVGREVPYTLIGDDNG